jgi:hypothetical protein
VTGLAYAPDGSALVFANDHGGDEKTDLFLLRAGQDVPEDQRGDLLFVRDGATVAVHPPRADGIAYVRDALPDGRLAARPPG